MLDKTYNLENFLKKNSVFIAFECKSSCTNLENYTDRHERFYVKQPQCCLVHQVFCIMTTINLFLKSTVEHLLLLFAS